MLRSKLSHVVTSIIVGCLVVNTSLSPAFSQSTDRDNPTPLTTNVLSGRLPQQSRYQVLYYRFTAKPGKMAIEIDGDRLPSGINSIVGLDARLETPDGEKIFELGISKASSREVGSFEFNQETPVVLLVVIDRGMLLDGDYTYLIKINGDWKELIKSKPNL